MMERDSPSSDGGSLIKVQYNASGSVDLSRCVDNETNEKSMDDRCHAEHNADVTNNNTDTTDASCSPISNKPQQEPFCDDIVRMEQKDDSDMSLEANNNDGLQPSCEERASTEMSRCLALFGVTSLEHLESSTITPAEDYDPNEKKQAEGEIVFETGMGANDPALQLDDFWGHHNESKPWDAADAREYKYDDDFSSNVVTQQEMEAFLVNEPLHENSNVHVGSMQSFNGDESEKEQGESSDCLDDGAAANAAQNDRLIASTLGGQESNPLQSDRAITSLDFYLQDTDEDLPQLDFPDDIEDNIPMISFQLPKDMQGTGAANSPAEMSDGASVLSGSTFATSTWYDAPAPSSASVASLGQSSVAKLRSELVRSSAVTATTTSTAFSHLDQDPSSSEDGSASFEGYGDDDDETYCSFQTALTQQQEVDQVVRMAEWMKRSLSTLVDGEEDLPDNHQNFASGDNDEYDVHSKPISLGEQLARLERQPQSNSKQKNNPVSLDEHFARDMLKTNKRKSGKSRVSLFEHFGHVENDRSSKPKKSLSLVEHLAALENPPKIKRSTAEEDIRRHSSPTASPPPDRLSFQDQLQLALKMIMKRLFHKAYVYTCSVIPYEWWGRWLWWYNLFQQCFPRRRGKSNWDRRLFAHAVALLVLTLIAVTACRYYFRTNGAMKFPFSREKRPLPSFHDRYFLHSKSSQYAQESNLLTGKLLEEADYTIQI
mmetsp:Transcript_27903/g.76793  ORF Transcript_27903/g.76793 Transcript_27903/m.76793 type:complete len:715 (-) Transcript_27903:75-2219(-)